MPWHDWQFWVVTGCALAAGVVLARRILPKLIGRSGGSGGGTKATLTIGGKAQRPPSGPGRNK